MNVADPYASNYPLAWGAEVSVVSTAGTRFKVTRKDCKGDPELALDNADMCSKALGLLHYAGLDEKAANRVCDSVLVMPASTEPTTLFSDFIANLLKQPS